MYIPSEQIKHVLLSTGYLNTTKEKNKSVSTNTNNSQTDMNGPVVSSQFCKTSGRGNAIVIE